MDELAHGSECYGCSACCVSCPVNAITMTVDEKGFRYPEINLEQCIHCNKCIKACQRVHSPNKNGEYLYVCAMQHKSLDVLKLCSSGGAFVALSDYILSSGGVVVGAVFDPELKKVVHRIAHTVAERNKMCGSKYVQSDISDILLKTKEEVSTGKLVLFTGTPCQVSALKAFLENKDYDNLYTIDVICHGVPSPKVFVSYIEYQEKKHSSSIKDYKFRSKKYGYEYTTELSFADGKTDSSIDAKRLLKLYTLNMRDSCYECQFASKERVGDATIGDMWKRPDNVKVKDHVGCSTVILNTDKGKDLFDKIKGKAITIPVQLNPEKRQALSHPVVRKPRVDTFWQDYSEHGIDYVLDKYAKVSMKSFFFFEIIKTLHGLRQYALVEKIKKHVSEM